MYALFFSDLPWKSVTFCSLPLLPLHCLSLSFISAICVECSFASIISTLSLCWYLSCQLVWFGLGKWVFSKNVDFLESRDSRDFRDSREPPDGDSKGDCHHLLEILEDLDL